MTSKIQKIELSGSGEELAIRAVGTATVLLELQRQFPQPSPPVTRVNYGTDDNPDWRAEVNYGDPDYIGRTLPNHKLMLDSKFANIILKRAVVKRPLTDEEKEAVSDVREDYKEEGIEIGNNDFSIWVRHIACAGDGDLNDLITKIRLLGDPTVGVESEEDSFRGEA